MAIAATRFSRVSIGFVDSVRSIVDVDAGDTGTVFSVTGAQAFTGDLTLSGSGSDLSVGGTSWVGGAATQIGAATYSSTISSAGTITGTNGVLLGGGSWVRAISTGTAAVSLGAISPLDSSSVVTVGLSNATRGDYIGITVDAIYPIVAANRDVTWMCSSSSTAGEVHVWGVNSTLTAVTPTASTVVRLVRMNFASYI